MADISHLEKMGRELKCPICLSLLKSSVSLSCNHVFCNSCVMESMKSITDCPVCKVPFRRREIRPAPHMDNLVTVFKNMEAAAGVNIFTTQQCPSTTQPGNTEKENDKEDKESTGHGKSREKKSREKRATSVGKQKLEKQAMPSCPAKKRIHVTPFPASETPIRSKKVSRENKISNVTDNSKSLSDGKTMINDECIGTALSPFFWLREGSENNETSSRSSGQLIEDTTQSEYVPSFSQIKDSEDEKSPMKKADTRQFNVEDVFDSEMFEWTQRACSPELCSTPTKKQTACKDKLGATQETKMELSNEIPQSKSAKNPKKGLKNKKFSQKKGVRSAKNKRLEKTRDNTLEKCSNVAHGHGDSLKETDPEILVESIEIIKDSFEEEMDDPQRVLLSCGREYSSKGKKTNNVRQKNNSATTKGKAENMVITETRKRRVKFLNQHNKKSKKASVDSSVTSINGIHSPNTKTQIREIHNSAKTPSVHESDIDGHMEALKEPKGKRKRKNVASEAADKIANEVAITTPETYGSNLTGKSLPNCKTLERCEKLRSQTMCAFCQSSNSTMDSGEMIHYFNGKPVEANYNDGDIVIHSHKHCAEWAPDVYFQDDMAVNLTNEVMRSRRIKCSCCGIKGAALGCFEKSCRRSYHFTCAKLVPECRWDNDNFVMLCPLHSSSKLPIEDSKLLKQGGKMRSPKINLKATTVFKNESDTDQKWTWPSGSPCKWIFCCSALTIMEKDVMTEFTELTGIPISKTWSPSVTHVIASTDENGACKRTLKFLMGVLEGKWIVGIEWVKACLKAMQPVVEEQYEIKKDVHGISGGPKLGRLRALNKEPKLFECLAFYFAGEFNPSYKGYIQDLISAAGGKILHRKPLTKDEEELFGNNFVSKTAIIYSAESPKSEKVNKMEAKGIGKACGATVASSSWIINSIAACKLQPLL